MTTPGAAPLIRVMPPLLAALCAFEIAAALGDVPAPHRVADPAQFTLFTAGAFAAAFILHLGTRPGLLEVGVTVGVACAIARIDLTLGVVVVAGNALGKASLVVLAARAVVARREARAAALVRLGNAAVLPMFLVAVLPALHLTAVWHPETYDNALYRIDAAFGGQASFALSRLFLQEPILDTLCRYVYLLLPIAVAALIVVPDKRPARASMIEAFVAAGALGFAVYHLCPASGPIYAFRAVFPYATPRAEDISPLPAVLTGLPRNCVPSLHTTWALFLVWHARPKGAVATALAVIWLVFTEMATLGLGEHYVADLVVAVPFAVAVDALARHGTPLSRPERHRPIVMGCLLVAIWVIAIRDPYAKLAGAPVVALALAAVTVAVPLALRHDLVRRDQPVNEIV